MKICRSLKRKTIEFSIAVENFNFSLVISSKWSGSIGKQKQGKCTLWSCIMLSSLLSCPCVFLTEGDRQCILAQEKNSG